MIKKRFEIVHVPWLLLFISLFSIALKSGSEIVVLNFGNAFRIMTVCLAALISLFFILKNKYGAFNLLRGAVGCFLLYGILAVISGAYASVGLYSVWKSIEIIASVLAIGAVLSCYPQREAVIGLYRVAIISFVLILASIWVGAVIAPDKAFGLSRGLFSFQLSGVFPPINANGVAFIAAFIALIFFIRFLQSKTFFRKVVNAGFFLGAFAALILAQSRTSIVGFVSGLIVFLFFDRRRKLLLFTFGVLAIAFSLQITISYLQRGQSKELAMALSGRTVAWEMAWDYFLKSPYIGNGFASAGRFDVLKAGETSTLHGSIFDVLVGVGLLGFVPWMLGIILTIIRLVWPIGRPRGRPRSFMERAIRAEFLAVMALILVRSTTSSGIALFESTFLLFLILVAFSTTRETARYNEAQKK